MSHSFLLPLTNTNCVICAEVLWVWWEVQEPMLLRWQWERPKSLTAKECLFSRSSPSNAPWQLQMWHPDTVQCHSIIFVCLFVCFLCNSDKLHNELSRMERWKTVFFSLEETKNNKKIVFFSLKKFRSLNTFLYSVISLLLDTKNVFQ